MTTVPGDQTYAAWPLDIPPADYEIGHVRAVLPDTVVDDARIVVRDGVIAEVGPHPGGATATVDGSGLLCVPGLIDIHSDGLERERMPRPGTPLEWDFAITSFEGKLRAAGITTVFHGARFAEDLNAYQEVSQAVEMCDALAAWNARPGHPVDHRILHRLDVRSARGLATLKDRCAKAPGVHVISHEDHTPGIGQFADRTQYEKYLIGVNKLSEQAAREFVDNLIVERDANLPVRDLSLRWLADEAADGNALVFGHDPESAAEIGDLQARGGTVAEFPTTVAAARAARERGMAVVMGAPNVMRGGSHSGNVSAAELAGQGLVTALASDYLPSALLASALRLADAALLALPAAVALVTSGAADAVGLAGRGALAPGQRADLALVSLRGPHPVFRAVLRAS